MKTKIISKKRLEISIVCALIFSLLVSISHFEAVCEDMKSNVLRLHIIANSNSIEDQSLKLKVRDEILKECGYIFDGNTNIEEAIITAQEHLEDFRCVANKVIKENGFDYSSSAQIGTSFFETREYDAFTLPAGEYKSLIVKLGKAEGKNWWCVVFPTVCIPTAAGELEDSLSKESSEIASNPQKYIMRFKIVEIYEEIKNLFKK